jgi:hypothetical protein
MDSNDCYVIENKPPSARSENNWENNSEDILHEESESMQQIPDTNHSESGSYYEPQPSDQQYQLDMMYT